MGHQDLQYGWTSGHNSVGGIGLQLTFKNMSEKTIKYIYFYFFAYNAVGDVQECSTTGKVKACLKYTGPLEPEKVARNTWDCVWYNSTISTCTLSEVEIEYMDGSTEKIDGGQVSRYEGCYVATAVYGSYDCPQVWTLRRYRDYTLAKTWYGRAFIHVYYAISPTLVKWFGKKSWFKKIWKKKLDKMVRNLNEKGVEDTPYSDLPW